MQASSNLSGTVLAGRYRLQRILGMGGMGVVYAAERDDHLACAVKVLHREFASDGRILSRFLEEARTGQKLRHPNIVQQFDAGKCEHGPFLVMELLSGNALTRLLSSGQRVRVEEAFRITQGILAGIGYAHGLGIVHRDLKPDNIFLVGSDGVVKVLDFGIAKVIDAAGGVGARTQTGALLGTPAYMSPEQIMNPRGVDPRTDLFSIGALLYEMLAGKSPFPVEGLAVLTAILGREPIPIRDIDPALDFVWPVIARSLEKDPQRRFASADEMSRTLSSLTSGLEATGRPPPMRTAPIPVTPRSTGAHYSPPVAQGQAQPPAAKGATLGIPATTRAMVAPPQPASPRLPGRQASTPPPPDAIPTHTLSSERDERASVPARPLVVVSDGDDSNKRTVRGGVAPTLVVVMVMSALAAGFLLGFAYARSL